MNGDEATRAQLRELLFDGVPLPSDAAREAMLQRTFAAEPGAGAELLPPAGLFDPAPDGATDPADGSAHDGDAAFHDGNPADGDFGDRDVSDGDVGDGAGDVGDGEFGDDPVDHPSDIAHPGHDHGGTDAPGHDAPFDDAAGDPVEPGDQSW